MPVIIHTSGLRLARLAEPVQRQQPAVRWPIRRGGRIEMVAIPPERIPAGWQSIHARVPHRLATCEETDCPMYLGGWTEVMPGDGSRIERPGNVTPDEAAATIGIYGDRAPLTIFHPPGTPCPRIHKTASGAPPLYRVNGLVMEEAAFLDAIGEGVYAMQQRIRAGSY